MSKLEELIKELCPNGVEYRKLSEIVKMSRGVRVVRSQLTDDGRYPVFQNSMTPLGYYSEYNCLKDTVFLISAGAAGEIGYSDTPFWTADDCWYFECGKNLIGRFLYYALACKQEYIFSRVRKASVPRLSRNVIDMLQIPLPPLAVQREIVRILDKFTLYSQELAAELAARKKQYEFYRDKLLSYNIMQHETTLLELLAQPITDGPHETPELYDSGVPFISAEAIHDTYIDFSKKRGCISPEYNEQCNKKYKPQKGDVFLVKSGSTTGKVAMVTTDDVFNIWSPIAAMRVNENNSARFLFYLLQTDYVQQQVKKYASHGSQPNLSMRKLEQFKVFVPPLEVQKRIVKVLDNFDAICSDLGIGLPAEIEKRQQQYEFYRDKLLTFGTGSATIFTERQTDRQG